MPIENNLDVKQTAEASSAVANDVKPNDAASSTAQTAATDVKPASMAEAVQQMLETDHGIKPESSTEGAPESPVQELNATEKDESKEGVEETATTTEVDKVEDKGPVPYERFSEVVAKHRELEQSVEQTKPYVEAQRGLEQFCEQHSITNDDFKQAMEIAALMKFDPQAAFEKLKPMFAGLQVLNGDTLPADLQAKVDDGVMPKEDAQELAKLRAQAKFGTERARLTEQQTQQQRAAQAQQRFIGEMQQGLNSWEQSKAKDLTYKPKADANAPDGMYELVKDRWLNLMTSNPPKTTQQAVALAEQAYQSIKKVFAPIHAAKVSARRSLPSNGSSTTISAKPKTMLEAVGLALQSEHGITI